MSEAPNGRGEMPPSGRPQRRGQPPRTINANHLLNFQPSQGPSQRGGRGRGVADRRRPPRGPRPQAYDKRKFLQANFRFMVSDAADIARYELDPDLMLEWEDIAAVDVAATAPVVCPITLVPLLVPCITPCGHIFSAEAIMTHLITQGGPELRMSSSCPVCTHDVAARELRSVTVRQVDPVRVGDRVDLVLLRRGRHSIIPHPIEAPTGDALAVQWGSGSAEEPASRGDALHCNPYAKFTAVADPTPLWAAHASILARKAAQLLAEGGTDAEYEVPPVLAAVDALVSRAKAWAERRQRFILDRMDDDEAAAIAAAGASPEEAGRAVMAAVRAAVETATAAEEAVHRRTAAAQVLEAEFPSLSVGQRADAAAAEPAAAAPAAADAGPGGLEPSQAPSDPDPEPAAPTDDAIYLYQSVDGQPVFLCPFNMKMLVEWRGSYAALPRRLSATVVDLEEVEQSEVSRKRLRGLNHMTLGATYRLCELDLAGAVPAEALAPFEAELAARAKKRVQQAKQEARRTQREAAAAAAKAAAEAAASSGPSLAELAAMPLPTATLRSVTDPMDVPGAELEPEEEEEGSLDGGSGSAPGVSFARIAKMGFAATGPALGEAPGLSSPPQPGPAPVWGHSPPAASGVWGGGGSGTWGTAGSSGQQAAPAAPAAPKGSGKGKKGKMLLLSTSQRRY